MIKCAFFAHQHPLMISLKKKKHPLMISLHFINIYDVIISLKKDDFVLDMYLLLNLT